MRAIIGFLQPRQWLGGINRSSVSTTGGSTPAIAASSSAVRWSPSHITPACITSIAGRLCALSRLSPAVSASRAHLRRIGHSSHMSIASKVSGWNGWGLVKIWWFKHGGRACMGWMLHGYVVLRNSQCNIISTQHLDGSPLTGGRIFGISSFTYSGVSSGTSPASTRPSKIGFCVAIRLLGSRRRLSRGLYTSPTVISELGFNRAAFARM